MIPPEFSRTILLDRIAVKEKSFDFDATEAECAALAERLGVVAVKRMQASVAVKLTNGGKLVRVKGRVQADLLQICVVTLEPIATKVDEPFTRFFSVDERLDSGEVVVDLNEEDPPDPVIDGMVDMGEAAAEHLALAMDPFPRSPGESFTPPPEAPVAEPIKPSPFEVLADHRKKI